MSQTKDKTATVNARESYLRNDGGPTEVLEFPSECQYGKMRSILYNILLYYLQLLYKILVLSLLAPVFYIIVEVFDA